jgi:DNA-binding PadR family transcriptional regulator
MSASTFLLSLIEACGGSVYGRTLLQKKSYFVSLLSRIPIDLGYQAHFYGPYSATVDGTLTQLKNLGFVEESSTGFGIVSGGFEMRRYDYRITEDGRKVLEPVLQSPKYSAIKGAVQAIRDAGEPDYMKLSIAAKAYYILQKQGKRMSANELLVQAKEFNWSISEQSLVSAVEFLKRVGLAVD